mgnify:CR=1 FL=1
MPFGDFIRFFTLAADERGIAVSGNFWGILDPFGGNRAGCCAFRIFPVVFVWFRSRTPWMNLEQTLSCYPDSGDQRKMGSVWRWVRTGYRRAAVIPRW